MTSYETEGASIIYCWLVSGGACGTWNVAPRALISRRQPANSSL